MHAVILNDVSFGYGADPVVRAVALAIEPGEFFTVLGPSGCGKTTLLKLIGGYLSPATGRIHFRGRDVTDVPPEGRNAGMVFQNYALFPHLSARDNVAFGLDVRGVRRAERTRRVDSMLDRVGLPTAARGRRPNSLSGGEQQRVALARALVIQPDALLLDEPLANLDRSLRDQLRGELRALQRETGVTTILVTHDPSEALAISDRIGVVQAGQIVQVGTPAEIYAKPRTPFVARSLGPANLLSGGLINREAGLMMIRPEQCELNPPAAFDGLVWPGRIALATFLGADWLVDVLCDNGTIVHVGSRAGVPAGERVTVGLPESALRAIPDSDDVISAAALTPARPG